MTLTVVGTQLGDEGKGGVVDLYSDPADVIVRYQGGDNAGHTVVLDDEEYKLSLVPSGAIRGKTGLLGNGCVVNPRTLFAEIDTLKDRGIDPNVKVAKRAHVILPYHRVLDGIEETAKEDSDLEAGTTGRGIGPCYEDKAARRGIRIGDLLDPDVLRTRLEYVIPYKRAILESVYDREPDEAFDLEALHEEFRHFGDRLEEENMAVNASDYLATRQEAGDTILFEGAQGTGIDIDHGIYPYVTSSNPTAGGASTGSGVGPTVIGQGEVVGIVKAYLSRVGTGPLPTELEGETAEYIREEGGEYGTVTGRPRRVGWLDLPMLRHACAVSGFTGLVLNHIDVLAGLDSVYMGTSYELDGETIDTMPATTEAWGRCEPTFREFDGWPEQDWEAVVEKGYDALSPAAKTYVEFLETELDTPIYAIGVGPGRSETIVREMPL